MRWLCRGGRLTTLLSTGRNKTEIPTLAPPILPFRSIYPSMRIPPEKEEGGMPITLAPPKVCDNAVERLGK